MRYIYNLSGETIYDYGKEASDKTVVESAVKEGVSLEGANLKWAKLKWAKLKRANLNYANLKGANLNYALLDGASLKGANLKGASLFFASLEGASLFGASLERASLVGANLSNATICIDGKTVKLKHVDYNYNNLTIEAAEALSIKHWEQIHSILDKGENYQKPKGVVITKSGLVISTGGDGCAHCAYKRQESNATCALGSCGNCCNGLWCEFQMNPTAGNAKRILDYIKSKQEGE